MGSKNNSWMSFSDLMTGLMVIFMFVAISYILEVQKAEQQRQKVVTDFQDSKSAIYKDLRSAFDEEKKEWEMEIGKDLSIRFTNPQVLFALGKSDVTPTFQKILNDFLPRYFNILLKEEYRTRIKEIRIEGHTDTLAIYSKSSDPYIGNVLLSQERSAKVLEYFRQMEYYKNLSEKQKEQLQYWITANGLSYGRTLDDNKQESFLSHEPINANYSRRVEFRIITTSEELIENIVNDMQK